MATETVRARCVHRGRLVVRAVCAALPYALPRCVRCPNVCARCVRCFAARAVCIVSLCPQFCCAALRCLTLRAVCHVSLCALCALSMPAVHCAALQAAVRAVSLRCVSLQLYSCLSLDGSLVCTVALSRCFVVVSAVRSFLRSLCRCVHCVAVCTVLLHAVRPPRNVGLCSSDETEGEGAPP